MPHVTNAAYKAWQQSLTLTPFAEWLEKCKASGLFWGA